MKDAQHLAPVWLMAQITHMLTEKAALIWDGYLLTFEVLGEVDLGHVVVDFATLVGWDVGRWFVPLGHELLKEWVHLPVNRLPVVRCLHR